ncbi:SpeB [Desulforapulum autotrophicum HRM2]|uniref:SpeB n=1 Tax=Desulforapulum autotrophicum (strain ATCC 43914 / DSM 3382 / VKM B-1955 / HRM2) TaxID=177437 RepID=C0QEE4_DESAH|nr:agmatinase [Desulforapulum autotrophicum]ACN13261.1 SpeB [Desulforapulum autotrophicum HRM2]
MSPTKPPGFLASELGETRPESCLFHVIPACYEKSVSYGKGAGQGPLAILDASQQLELYDGSGIPAQRGIFTHPVIDCGGPPEKELEKISGRVKDAMAAGKVPVLLGGEHTVTVGALKALEASEKSVGIVQFDAHADLRDTYEGTGLSHACVMHRALDMGFYIYQIGVRSLSPGEVVLRREREICHLDAAEIADKGIPDTILPDDFPEQVYITFDVDGLDPSVIQATGTPEPGGLFWYDAMEILEKIAAERKIIGFDVVELAPIPGFHTSDFASARLVYNIMGMIDRNTP